MTVAGEPVKPAENGQKCRVRLNPFGCPADEHRLDPLAERFGARAAPVPVDM
jgi:hypothetical protein